MAEGSLYGGGTRGAIRAGAKAARTR